MLVRLPLVGADQLGRTHWCSVNHLWVEYLIPSCSFHLFIFFILLSLEPSYFQVFFSAATVTWNRCILRYRLNSIGRLRSVRELYWYPHSVGITSRKMWFDGCSSGLQLWTYHLTFTARSCLTIVLWASSSSYSQVRIFLCACTCCLLAKHNYYYYDNHSANNMTDDILVWNGIAVFRNLNSDLAGT